MSTEENKTLVHRLFNEEFNKLNSTVIEEIVAADYIDHSAIPAPVPGVEGFKKRTAMLRAAFAPKMSFGEFLAENDLVAFSWTMDGVHQGAFAGVQPTGKKIMVSGINIERMKDGKVIEHWSHFDMAGLMKQINT
ncbi:MAG: ester cyclase [Anaerolineales bacterium]